MAVLVLLRHGETEWSRQHRHTGRTDLPLTAAGEQMATQVGERLRARPFGLVLSSPLQRATRTAAAVAAVAGVDVVTDPDLVEWDYGAFEGRSTEEIRAERGPEWSVWAAAAGPDGLGESLAALAARTDRVLARAAPVLAGGADVLLVGHAHALRVLTARWLGLPAARGRSFVLAVGALGELGHEREEPVLLSWSSAAG